MNIFSNNYDFDHEPKHTPIDSIVVNNMGELGVLQFKNNPVVDFKPEPQQPDLITSVVDALKLVSGKTS